MTSPAGGANLSVVKPAIPAFEGSAISSTTQKITGTCAVDGAEDKVLMIDDRVRLVGDYRVVGVAFKVDPKSGDTVREHILKPVEVALCPWNPADPLDDGIARARPAFVPIP